MCKHLNFFTTNSNIINMSPNLIWLITCIFMQHSWKWFIYYRCQNVNRQSKQDGNPRKKSEVGQLSCSCLSTNTCWRRGVIRTQCGATESWNGKVEAPIWCAERLDATYIPKQMGLIREQQWASYVVGVFVTISPLEESFLCELSSVVHIYKQKFVFCLLMYWLTSSKPSCTCNKSQ